MDRPKSLYRVGISGSYGGLNLGDEAILQSIITQLRRSTTVEITVFSRNAEDTLHRHDVERAVPVRELSRNEVLPELKRLDLLILGGGGILYDGEAELYLREAVLSQEHGIPVMVYAIGAGPLTDRVTQDHVRDCLNRATLVTVRERRARQILEEIGVEREIRVTADPALLLQPATLPRGTLQKEGLSEPRRLVAMSVREPGAAAPDISADKYHALMANAADFMSDRFDADVVFIPMESRVLDVQHSHAVIAQMLRAPRAMVLKGDYTSAQLLTLMASFEFAVGMRLHFLIFAALQGVPFVALSYAQKVAGFIEELDLEMPPLKQVNTGRLLAHIDHSWDNRRFLRKQVCKKLPYLRTLAAENNRYAIDLLTSSKLSTHH